MANTFRYHGEYVPRSEVVTYKESNVPDFSAVSGNDLRETRRAVLTAVVAAPWPRTRVPKDFRVKDEQREAIEATRALLATWLSSRGTLLRVLRFTHRVLG
jgi:hypothetical protein